MNTVYANRDEIIPALKENIKTVIGCDVDDEIEIIDGMIRKSQMDLLNAGRDEAKIQAIGEKIVSLRERRQNVLTQAAQKRMRSTGSKPRSVSSKSRAAMWSTARRSSVT